MIHNFIGLGIGTVFVLVVIGKIFIDRQMTLAEGVPIATIFAIWGYGEYRGTAGGNPLLAALGLMLLFRFYQRMMPDYRRRLNERLELIQSKKPQRAPTPLPWELP